MGATKPLTGFQTITYDRLVQACPTTGIRYDDDPVSRTIRGAEPPSRMSTTCLRGAGYASGWRDPGYRKARHLQIRRRAGMVSDGYDERHPLVVHERVTALEAIKQAKDRRGANMDRLK